MLGSRQLQRPPHRSSARLRDVVNKAQIAAWTKFKASDGWISTSRWGGGSKNIGHEDFPEFGESTWTSKIQSVRSYRKPMLGLVLPLHAIHSCATSQPRRRQAFPPRQKGHLNPGGRDTRGSPRVHQRARVGGHVFREEGLGEGAVRPVARSICDRRAPRCSRCKPSSTSHIPCSR
jgi:hypothetical protein